MRLSIISIVVCGVLSTATSYAEQINIAEAQNNARQFLSANQKSLKGQSSRTSDRLTLAYTAQSNFNEDENCFYVFNRSNGGFIIAGADDCAQQVLGVADEGSFDYQNMPENMRWWLSQYTEQISNAMLTRSTSADELTVNKAVPTSTGTNTSSRISVPTMCQTLWDQGTYYNNECPEEDGVHCYTGCVATALAQVMKYHNYPDSGTGTLSFTSSGSTKLTVDFSEGAYDWNNMPNQLTNKSSEAEVNAVARLMYHCGALVQTVYYTSGSAANMTNILRSLPVYMGYSKSCSYRDRSYFTDSQWEEIIYNEMVNHRPVCYSGGTNANRHAFVCDGYNADDNTFHFNWGWSGNGNGYFKLTALEPFGPNSYYVYNAKQCAVIGIQPPTGNDKYDMPLYTAGNLRGVVQSSTLYLSFRTADNSSSKFTCVTNYCSYESNDRTNKLGIKLVNTETQETTIIQPSEEAYTYYTNTNSDASTYGKYWPKITSYIKNGESFIASPVYKDNEDEDWKPLNFVEGAITEVLVARNATDGKFNVTQVLTPADLHIDDINVAQAVAGKTLEADLTVSNLGQSEYVGELSVLLVDAQGAEAATFSQDIDVLGNTTQNVAVSGSLADISSGSYSLRVNTESGETVNSPETNINVKAPVITAIDDVENRTLTINSDNNNLWVTTQGDVESIEVYTTAGSLVASAHGSTSVSIENATTGIYLVKVICDGEAITKQILIKKDN